MGYQPSSSSCSSCPVENISWHEAAAMANELSASASAEQCYSCSGSGALVTCSFLVNPYLCEGYRLPTEAEWEYAARAGSEKAFWSSEGAADLQDVAGYYNLCVQDRFLDGTSIRLSELSWYCTSSGNTAHEVGLLEPNGLGLYDMHGNVWEWCHDSYDLYDALPQLDPVQESGGNTFVIRGGSYTTEPRKVRSAYRGGRAPDERFSDVGMRLVYTSAE